MIAVIKAIGRAIRILTLNLSDISHPCVRVAMMVVSEMKERLSPNIAPLMTTPSIMASGIPARSAIPTATGAKATIVPTDVPTDVEMKQAVMKIPVARRFPGKIERAKLTVASMAPIDLAVWAKAPANTNIKTMSMILLLAAPRQYCSIRLLSFPPLEIAIETIDASRKATVIGIL